MKVAFMLINSLVWASAFSSIRVADDEDSLLKVARSSGKVNVGTAISMLKQYAGHQSKTGEGPVFAEGENEVRTRYTTEVRAGSLQSTLAVDEQLARVHGPSATSLQSPTRPPPDDSSPIPERCGFERIPINYAIPGTAAANGDLPYIDWAPEGTTASMGLDFDGLWWMYGNGLAEEFITLKGLTPDQPGASSYPKYMSWYSNFKGRWVWPVSGYSWPNVGWYLMSFYALTATPATPQLVKLFNATHASIVPVAGGSGSTEEGPQYMLRKNMSDPSGDSWIRDNAAFPGDPNPEYIYTLARVINPDGTPNAKWWPKFLEFSEQRGINEFWVWGSNNNCQRRCEISLPCSYCKWWCGV